MPATGPKITTPDFSDNAQQTPATVPAQAPDSVRGVADTQPKHNTEDSTLIEKAPAQSSPAVADEKPATYVVKKGDTLSNIATRFLGKASRWPEIIKLNPGLKPQALRAGKIIKIPKSATVTEVVTPNRTAGVPAAPQDK